MSVPTAGRLPARMALLLGSITCSLCTLFSSGASAAVSQCLDQAGRTHFLQFDCPPGTRRVPPDPDVLMSVVVTAPLSAAEQQALEALERTLARDRTQRQQARARNARRQAARAAEQNHRCAEARERLTELERTRRKGYRATAEARLEAEEARLRAVRKASC